MSSPRHEHPHRASALIFIEELTQLLGQLFIIEISSEVLIA
jgi:hypothetical protein